MFKVFNSLNMTLIYVFSSLFTAILGSTADNYKDQFCTDPRTMQKHAAYSEWPDSYSCTRHRCQPGGRNLAIYTVGCKRVEAPESAIECEEVVEDTNMQFPYCCTRLRCLVVVRGEVWTRVLGQPWETLPAAPWSHMYKMKRPPPSDSAFANKNAAERGPVYELLSDNESEKTLRASKKNSPTTNHGQMARAVPSPDIVIALATPNDEKKKDNFRRIKAKSQNEAGDDEDLDKDHVDIDLDDTPAGEKVSWTEIPLSQWNEHDPAMDVENSRVPKIKTDKASDLQALVDAIGTRMRDIENVVQKMTEQVQNKPDADLSSDERRSDNEAPRKHQKSDERAHEIEELHGRNKASPAVDHYKRFSFKNRSEYLRNGGVTSERPALDDANLNGYFSDASNSVGRRSSLPEEPAIPPTYVAPVENRHRSRDFSKEAEKKRKKHLHKKKRKSKGHKRHHKNDKKKHLSSKNRLSSSELDKTVISLEDSSNL